MDRPAGCLPGFTSPIRGLGTFAQAPVYVGEIVVVWGGRLFSRAEVEAGIARNQSAVPVAEDLYLGLYAHEAGEIDEYMNHSCAPNVWMADEVTLVAFRDILPGEEITLDYTTFEVDPHWSIPCGCAAPGCRGRVTGQDWLLETLQEAYKDGLTPLVKRLLARYAGVSAPSVSLPSGLHDAFNAG